MALAHGNHQIVDHILKNMQICVVPRKDFSDPADDEDIELSPNFETFDLACLEHELRPLAILIAKRDWRGLQKIWRKIPVWDTPHFYKVLDLIIKTNESEGLRFFLSGNPLFSTMYYEASDLQKIVDQMANIKEGDENAVIKTQIQILIQDYRDKREEIELSRW